MLKIHLSPASQLDPRRIFRIVKIPERVYYTFVNHPLEPTQVSSWSRISPEKLSGFLLAAWCVITGFRYLAGRDMQSYSWIFLGILGSLCVATATGIIVSRNLITIKSAPANWREKTLRLLSVLMSCSGSLLCIISSILMTELYMQEGQGGNTSNPLLTMRLSLTLEALILSAGMALSVYFGLRKPSATYRGGLL